jgi:hypothetical protein
VRSSERKRVVLVLVALLIAWGIVTFFSGGYVTLALAIVLGVLVAKD